MGVATGKEMAAMTREVAEQVFAKMAPMKKRKVRADPRDQMLAAFENASISKKSSNWNDSSLTAGDSTKSSANSVGSTGSLSTTSNDSDESE